MVSQKTPIRSLWFVLQLRDEKCMEIFKKFDQFKNHSSSGYLKMCWSTSYRLPLSHHYTLHAPTATGKHILKTEKKNYTQINQLINYFINIFLI